MRFLTVDEVLALHDRALAEFGGAPGLRTSHALAYAVAAPQQSAFGEDAYPTLAARAAALAFFLTMNHPFVDGNKRTGLAALETMLDLNGACLTASDDEVVDVFERLAAGRVEPNAFFAWVAGHIGLRQADRDEE